MTPCHDPRGAAAEVAAHHHHKSVELLVERFFSDLDAAKKHDMSPGVELTLDAITRFRDAYDSEIAGYRALRGSIRNGILP